MHTILKKIDDLVRKVPGQYTEKEQQAHVAACLAIKEIVLESINPVTIRRNEAQPVKIRVDIDGRMAHRRQSDKRHPVRLVIYHKKEIKRYPLSKFRAHLSHEPKAFYFYKQEWKELWSQENHPIKEDLEKFEIKMAEITKEKARPFSFSKFEKVMGLLT